MKINSAKFVKGVVGTDDILLDGKPQIAFVGSSNVGKSSLINALTGEAGLARSSTTPGKTQEINFFLINGKNYFVDLPGYGFAKMQGKKKEKVRKMIIWYLSYAESRPKKVILVIDAKAGLKKFDLEMINMLEEENADFLIIANKIDKIKKNLIQKTIKSIADKVDLEKDKIIVFSSKTMEKRNEILNRIFN